MVSDSSNASELNGFETERLYLPETSQSHFYWHFCIFHFSYTYNNIASIPTQTACDFQWACKQGHLLNTGATLLRQFYHLCVNLSQNSLSWTDEMSYTIFENDMNVFNPWNCFSTTIMTKDIFVSKHSQHWFQILKEVIYSDHLEWYLHGKDFVCITLGPCTVDIYWGWGMCLERKRKKGRERL